ncbi:MAG: enoyl-CoA hydratase/isomerase family protein [Alphaproteobacteria bacterium]|nr:enoyl-CoA hydratase/isomerase family protein [Alphaproteobacteria bacterium]
MSKTFWTVSRDGAVVTAAFRNEPRNTLTYAGVQELAARLDEWEADPSVRVIVLTGASDRYFIAHYDVGELADASEAAVARQVPPPGEEEREIGAFQSIMLRFEASSRIVIAALNGQAMGGGFELALACDFRIARDGDWRYGLPETNVGIIPGAGGTQRMTRLIGTARALDLILHGRPLSADKALELGLIHRVFPPETYAASVSAFAHNLASRAPIALAEAKACIRAAHDTPLRAGLLKESAAFARCMASQDAAGAMRSWLEGRPFTFSGK